MSRAIKSARIKTGMTQEEAAEKLGVHPTTLNKYESGARFPSGKVLAKMSKLFKVPLDELIMTSISESESSKSTHPKTEDNEMLKDEMLTLQRKLISLMEENTLLKTKLALADAQSLANKKLG